MPFTRGQEGLKKFPELQKEIVDFVKALKAFFSRWEWPFLYQVPLGREL